MTRSQIHQLLAEGIDSAHGEIRTEALDDGVLLVERDGTEWWVVAEKQP